MSLPMRGEWIEIRSGDLWAIWNPRSLPMRGEWIEITDIDINRGAYPSLPMRGEWIEIVGAKAGDMITVVSPHAGRVD